MPKKVVVEMWECEFCGTQYHHEDTAKTCSKCQPQTKEEKSAHCSGCHGDFYNQHRTNGCWSLEGMYLTLRKAVHVDQVPPWNQKAYPFPNCYKRPKFWYVKPDQTC